MQSNLYSIIFYVKTWQMRIYVYICLFLAKLIQNNQKMTQMSEYEGKGKEMTGIRLKVIIF